jgi:hypothetical protein
MLEVRPRCQLLLREPESRPCPPYVGGDGLEKRLGARARHRTAGTAERVP